jgi:hypothetical protein
MRDNRGMKQQTSSKTRAVLAAALLTAIISITSQPVPAHASGGGGTGGGGSSSGGGTVPPSSSIGLLAYSNIGPVMPPADGSGYAILGLQPASTDGTQFFDYLADRFTPTTSGFLSSVRLPIHQYASGGNGQFTLRFFSDDPLVPGTLGALIGSYQGQSSKGTNTAASIVNISNGPKLVAGQMYWMEVIPSAQSREAWVPSQVPTTGIHYYIDPFSVIYYPNMEQGSFEIYVMP